MVYFNKWWLPYQTFKMVWYGSHRSGSGSIPEYKLVVTVRGTTHVQTKQQWSNGAMKGLWDQFIYCRGSACIGSYIWGSRRQDCSSGISHGLTVMLMAANVWSSQGQSKFSVKLHSPITRVCSPEMISASLLGPVTTRVDRSSGLFQGCVQGLWEARAPYGRCTLYTRANERQVR